MSGFFENTARPGLRLAAVLVLLGGVWALCAWAWLSSVWQHWLPPVVLAALAVGWRWPQRYDWGLLFFWALLVGTAPLPGVLLCWWLGGRKVAEGRRWAPLFAAAAGAGSSDLNLSGAVLLPDGRATLIALLRGIQKAQRSIDLATYALLPDTVGLKVLAALTERAEQGVRVRLLADAVGSKGLRQEHLAGLRGAGGEVRVVGLFGSRGGRGWQNPNLRYHRKMAIFDDQWAVFGGQNLDGRFLDAGVLPRASSSKASEEVAGAAMERGSEAGGGESFLDEPSPPAARIFRDFSVEVSGSAVAALSGQFSADWQRTESARNYRSSRRNSAGGMGAGAATYGTPR